MGAQTHEGGSSTSRSTQSNLRVALVGPLPPLRGGIPQHTASLQDALERRCNLLTIPFVRLYPQWLYPGESSLQPEGTDGIDGDGREVDALDPLSWYYAIARIESFRSEIVVIPWWTIALSPATAYMARACRMRGIAVTFLCHNVVDHESSAWKRILASRVLKYGSRFIVPSVAEAERLRCLLGDGSVSVHPHPVYRHLPPAESSVARRAEREFLFFGVIRPYKGLDVLLEALGRVSDSVDWWLTVAGEPWEDLGPRKRRAESLGIGHRIQWIERYVSDAEAAALFERSDVVVLPYRSATGCGVLALALGEARPVIASDLPGLREQVLPGKTGWLVEPENPAALASALVEADSERTSTMRSSVRSLAAKWTWETLAGVVLSE